MNQHLEVLPVLNKMDLPQADPAKVKNEIEEIKTEFKDVNEVSAPTEESEPEEKSDDTPF